MKDPTASTVEAIRLDPRFDELVRRRARLSLTLLALTLAAYLGLTTLVAFAPGLLLTPAAEGSRITLGIVLAVFVIVLGWAMTYVYLRANAELDEMSSHIIAEAGE